MENCNNYAETLKIVLGFIGGLLTGGITIRLMDIKLNNQKTIGTKSPNINGEKNRIEIK